MIDRTIFETKYWRVELHNKQLYLGRSKVFLKRDCDSLSDLTPEEWIDLHEVIKAFESLLTKTFGATMFNWSCLMNNAYQEKEPKPLVHWHVRSRYDHPVEFAGQIFKDEEFGHHYDRDKDINSPNVTDNLTNAIIQELKRTFVMEGQK